MADLPDYEWFIDDLSFYLLFLRGGVHTAGWLAEKPARCQRSGRQGDQYG